MSMYREKNPLQRDGTSQEQRVLKTLLPGYVAVDERSMDELISFVSRYAGEIVYYNQQNVADGDWKAFFNRKIDTKSQYNAPHFVLFMAFLKLFKHAQDEMNKITKKHLDHYYRDVLHLSENPAVPDQAYLIFELAKHVSSHALNKNTAFKAGKDALGNIVLYRNKEECFLNKATVAELQAVFANKHDIFTGLSPYPYNDYRLYVSKQADSEDGNGKELDNKEKSWRTFGGVTFPVNPLGTALERSADRKEADVGFAFASPNLFLAEGMRVVTLYLNLSSDVSLLEGLTDALFADAFRVFFSGEKKWIEPIYEETRIMPEEVDPVIAKKVLDFVNSSTIVKDLAHNSSAAYPGFNNLSKKNSAKKPKSDFGMMGIMSFADCILAERERLGSEGFTSLKQLYAMDVVDIDEIMHDLISSFRATDQSTTIDKANNRIIVKRTINRDQDAIVAYNEKILFDPFKTKWPVVKVLLNTESRSNPFIYKKLKRLRLQSVDIVADVKEVKNLVIQNDQSVLDPGKPFQPFGNRPVVGSNLYIGSWEAFQKSVNALAINIIWFDLPDEKDGFRDYYKAYIPDTDKRLNTSFLADISILDKKSWVLLTPTSIQLFNNQDNEPLTANKTLAIVASNPDGNPPGATIGNVENDEALEPFDIYDRSSRKGFVRLTLEGIDFGHKDYQASYAAAVMNSIYGGVQSKPPAPEGKFEESGAPYTLPKEPYTPQIEEVSIDYVATEHVEAASVPAANLKYITVSAYHIGALGVAELDASKSENYLLPQYDNEGELYIGIKDLDPPQNLSILFQISEGSSNPDLMPPGIQWCYLADDEWVALSEQNILSDSTKGLINTGLILFDIPSGATNCNTILSHGLYWLRAAAEKDSGGIPDMIDIRCQAARVTFEDNGNDPAYLGKPMPEKTISKPLSADSAIKKIEQPFTSFGGRLKEESDDFYTRVSERLRHKHRAITIWDYERIILQHFPSVYKVKCLNHTSYDGTLTSINEASPGHVSMIVVSNLRNKNAVDRLKPRTSLSILSEIEEVIAQRHSPAVCLHVQNPLFEEVEIECSVMLYRGFDKGMCQVQLEQSLIEFLSPWAYESGSDIVFGGKIHKSVILNFVEQQEYVDYITCFEMHHIIPGDPGNDPQKDVSEAATSTSASILVSASGHKINVMEEEGECRCNENETETTETAR